MYRTGDLVRWTVPTADAGIPGPHRLPGEAAWPAHRARRDRGGARPAPRRRPGRGLVRVDEHAGEQLVGLRGRASTRRHRLDADVDRDAPAATCPPTWCPSLRGARRVPAQRQRQARPKALPAPVFAVAAADSGRRPPPPSARRRDRSPSCSASDRVGAGRRLLRPRRQLADRHPGAIAPSVPRSTPQVRGARAVRGADRRGLAARAGRLPGR